MYITYATDKPTIPSEVCSESWHKQGVNKLSVLWSQVLAENRIKERRLESTLVARVLPPVERELYSVLHKLLKTNAVSG